MTIPTLTVALNPALLDNTGVKSSIASALSGHRSPLKNRAFEIRFHACSGLAPVETVLVGAPYISGIGPVRQAKVAALIQQACRVAVRQQTVGTVDFA